MRPTACLAALIAFCLPAATARPDSPGKKPGGKKPDPDRLRGMKAAVADIGSGKLNLRSFPPPATLWHDRYVGLLKAECGVEPENVPTAGEEEGIGVRPFRRSVRVLTSQAVRAARRSAPHRGV